MFLHRIPFYFFDYPFIPVGREYTKLSYRKQITIMDMLNNASANAMLCLNMKECCLPVLWMVIVAFGACVLLSHGSKKR
ncbi:hypothetical protein KKG44_03095 [Patescibacteria group bacterium]|nr:hypothetical protein [Patescibacteria group bacterium]MBU2460082.1 hypothetical protein [Patescibacteria group bacterium]MBU2544651.1 hypothetical protein [Patescibacteria group bacterium]